MSQSLTKQERVTGSKAASTKPPGHLNSITKTLKEKTEQTRTETEKLLQAEFAGLSKSLSGYVEDELNTITSDISKELNTIKSDLNTATEQINNEIKQLRKKRRLWPRVLLICLLICASSAATIILQDFWIRRSLSAKQAQLTQTQEELTQLNQTLGSAAARGIEIFNSNGSTFISLPQGLDFQTGFTTANKTRKAAKIVRN